MAEPHSPTTHASRLSEDSSTTERTQPRSEYDRNHSVASDGSLPQDPIRLGAKSRWSPAWRHTVGWILLGSTILMWTTSNFLSSYMFADDTYDKPFFVTYCDTAIFIVFLPMILIPKAFKHPEEITEWKHDLIQWKNNLSLIKRFSGRQKGTYTSLTVADNLDASGYIESPRSGLLQLPSDGSGQSLLHNQDPKTYGPTPAAALKPLTIAETARLGYRFGWLWFAANFSVATCFEYTSVASGTVITSLSSVFTLLVGTAMGVEKFTFPKLAGVVLSFLGIFLVYATDLFGKSNDDEHRGDFPIKSFTETLAGDMLALISAGFYGYYACQLTRDCKDESRINMLLFFGFVGLFNAVFLWPFFILFHFTGLEPFGLPPNGSVLAMVVSNALVSGISDMFWASAVLMLSPLMVTVGLSFSIPVSLIMQFILRHQIPTWLGGVGSAIVLASVLIVESDGAIREWYHKFRRSRAKQ